MKYLMDRREIADAINIKKYPVITIDTSKPINGDDFYRGSFSGSKVVLATPTKSYPDSESRCTVKMFGDETGNEDHTMPWRYKRIVLSEEMVGITASFGLRDVREMVEWNNAQHVSDGDIVVVFFDGGKIGHLRLMKVDRASRTLVDIDE